jgi:hypothetical protein
MNCVSCGKSIPGGARYCIHCGVEQAVPTPIAAVAAAGGLARVARREAANAAHAEPVRLIPDAAAETEAFAHPTMTRGEPDLETAATQPAYASGPDRRGLAIALIVAAVVVAGIALAVMLWRSPPRGTEPGRELAPAARSEAAVPSAASPAPLPEPERSATPAPESVSPAAEPPALPPPATEPPVQIEPLPPRPAPQVAPRPARRAPEQRAETPSPPSAKPTTAVPAAPPAPAAQSAPPHVADRWQRMEDEMSHCTREDFISRVICGQRVRFKYCDGYWGKVPQCPASPPPERGQ